MEEFGFRRALQIFWPLALLATQTMSAPMTDEMMQMAQMLHNSCVEETGVQEDLIQKATKGSFTEDPKLKCYMKCIYTEMGGISEDGELDAEAIAAVLPDEVHEAGTKMINSCKDTKGDDTCDMAYKFNVCMHAVDPKNYMLI